MDNVQNCDSYINKPYSQIYTYHDQYTLSIPRHLSVTSLMYGTWAGRSTYPIISKITAYGDAENAQSFQNPYTSHSRTSRRVRNGTLCGRVGVKALFRLNSAVTRNAMKFNLVWPGKGGSERYYIETLSVEGSVSCIDDFLSFFVALYRPTYEWSRGVLHFVFSHRSGCV
jgi:hypothetical protein